ncbi:MAG TPA: hypothetical protein VN285_06430 [Candidatus Deferrimicrobium sp.]|nr:hypothetical protein [Candidatus Deferrimicrobium sp.]
MKLQTSRVIQGILVFACLLGLFGGSPAAVAGLVSRVVAGRVTDEENIPIDGASVSFYINGNLFSGCPADSSGQFCRRMTFADSDSLTLRVSSVGYTTESVSLSLQIPGDTIFADLALHASTVEMAAVTVTPPEVQPIHEVRIDGESLKEAAAHSIVPTNPISAIRQPQVVREGSNHSSKLRVNGTSPRYYINGVEIGANPNHYGVFSIIPASVLNDVAFYPHGTDAGHGSASVIDMRTARPFRRHANGELNLSFVEATGSFSVGGERYFVLGSLRKSVLDKLVRYFDVGTERRTLPPTNFQDVFGSSGLRLSSRHTLIVDQYHVRDFLSITSGGTLRNPGGVNTALHTAEHYVGARWESAYDRVLVNLSAAVHTSAEVYQASTARNLGEDELTLDLRARRQTNLGSVEMTAPVGDGLLTLGNQVEFTSRNNVQMRQHNWNFLSPEANSDNLNSFQPELNQVYGSYGGHRRYLSNAAFVTVSNSIWGMLLETGLRGQYFDYLDNGFLVLTRNRVTVKTGQSGRLTMFVGTFAESPVDRILDPYQVLIHADLNRLKPITSRLASVDFSVGAVKVGVFAKEIANIPTLTPDFARVNADGSIEDGFISMRSTAKQRFYGGSIDVERDSLLSPRFDLRAFYGYTRARKAQAGVSMPYELNAPHRLFADVACRLSRVVRVGAELGLRSGFAYTPSPDGSVFIAESRLTSEFYEQTLTAENSARFPVNATLNLHVTFDFGGADLFLSVANVTNRANAMINTSDGYIYDAGILPSVGFRWRL